jgi:hypothetical protein
MNLTQSSYTSFAREIILAGQNISETNYSQHSNIRLGSKIVRISTTLTFGHGRIDPIPGLINAGDNSVPEYTIVFMDGKSTGFFPETSTFDQHDFPLGQVRTNLTKPYRVAIDTHTRTVQVLDPRSGTVVIWVADVDDFPYWAAATPFRLALAWIADTFDGELLHGAVIARDGKCLVITGRSGSGKSTLTYHSQRIGFQILSDDFFLYESGKMFPIYTRAKLHDASIALLSGFPLTILNPNTLNEKRIVQLSEAEILSLAKGMTPCVYLVPQPEGRSELEVATQGEVFRHLGPYSVSGLLGGTERSFLRTKRAISNSPAFKFQFKRSRDQLIGDLETIWSHCG